jgi:Bifunctional DNA primase/polymerase, N-terminal
MYLNKPKPGAGDTGPRWNVSSGNHLNGERSSPIAISQQELLAATLKYAAAGLPVFPLVPRTKDPATKRGFYDATANPATIRRYWRVPDRNIGMPTGAVSGVWILDIDPGGEEHLQRLEDQHGPLPPTRAVRTPRGGRHLWFKYTGPIQCSAGRVAEHIDVRGDGGYCILPPSILDNGRYTWLTFAGADLAIAPDWLVGLTRKKISERARVLAPLRSTGNGVYGAAALNAEVAAVAACLPGTRNDALNKAAFALFQLVAGGELDGGVVEDRLIHACHVNGLVKDDGLPSVIATIASGKRAGLQYPRSRSGRLA